MNLQIAENYKMYKNEQIEIRPLQNAYKLSYEYRVLEPTQNNPKNWEYVTEDYMFKTWDEVVEWVKNKPLDVPPVKL